MGRPKVRKEITRNVGSCQQLICILGVCHAAVTCQYNNSGHRILTHAAWCSVGVVCCVSGGECQL